MTALYTDGTITLVQGSPLISGNDTGWAVALIVGGVVYVEADGGNDLPILPDDSEGANLHPITDTQMTSAIKWTGPSGTFKYAIVRDMSYSRQQSANANALATLLQRLNAAPVAAISGIVPEEDTLILFTGPDTAAVIPRSSLVQGVDYDEDADDIAGRNFFNGEVKGFSVLVADSGDGRTAIFIKRSNTNGDWSAPFYLSGPQGDKGDTGETGITWRGQWNNVDAYALNDVVRNNKSAWIALRANTNVAPPVLPTEANADWELFARAGVDGTGTGNVVAPAGAGNNHVALFDGTSGELLKDSGVTLGNAASRNVGTGAGSVAAGDDPRFADAGKNDAIIGLVLADLIGRSLSMKGGVADAFEDETGVGLKTNAVYDAANDWYMPSAPAVATSYANAGGTGNRTSTVTVTTDVTLSGGPVSNIVNGSTVGDDTNSTSFAAQSVAGKHITFQFSSPRVIDEARFIQTGGGTWAQGTWKWQGSNNGADFTDIGASFALGVNGSQTIATLAANTLAYTHYRLLGVSGNTTGSPYVAEVEFKIGNPVIPNNMTLRNVAHSAAVVPTSGRLGVQLVETDAIVINADVIGRMSRDGGATWATAALALSQPVIGPKIYEATGIDLTSLGSGTSILWEIATANNKNVAVSGVFISWS